MQATLSSRSDVLFGELFVRPCAPSFLQRVGGIAKRKQIYVIFCDLLCYMFSLPQFLGWGDACVARTRCAHAPQMNSKFSSLPTKDLEGFEQALLFEPLQRLGCGALGYAEVVRDRDRRVAVPVAVMVLAVDVGVAVKVVVGLTDEVGVAVAVGVGV